LHRLDTLADIAEHRPPQCTPTKTSHCGTHPHTHKQPKAPHTCGELQLPQLLVPLQRPTAQLLVGCDDVQPQLTQPVGVVLGQGVRGSTVQQYTSRSTTVGCNMLGQSLWVCCLPLPRVCGVQGTRTDRDVTSSERAGDGCVKASGMLCRRCLDGRARKAEHAFNCSQADAPSNLRSVKGCVS
jgi:hypothetical protein